MKSEAKIRASLADETNRLAKREAAFMEEERAYKRQLMVVNSLRRELKNYPRDLYWSNVTVKPWPMEIIQMVTACCGIAEKLYTQGKPSHRLMVHPKTLEVLHVKHAFISRSVLKYKKWVLHWLRVNNVTVSAENPRWKTCEVAPSLKDMASRFYTRKFRVGKLRMRILGTDGIVEFDTLEDSDKILKAVRKLGLGLYVDAPFEAAPGRVIVPYKPVPGHVQVLFGGRGKLRRLVKTLN